MRCRLALLTLLCCAVPAQAQSVPPVDIPALQAKVMSKLEAIAIHQDIAASLRKQNARYQAMTENEIDAMRALWHGEQLIKERPLIKAVTEGTAAKLLKDAVARTKSPNPLYVTDMRGLVVAATDMPADYRLTPEALWEQAFLIGPHRLIVTPITHDAAAPMWVSVAVTDPKTQAVIGVVSTYMTVPRAALAEDEESDEFEMRRPQELIYGSDPFYSVASVDQSTGIPRKTGGVAGN